MPEEVPFSERLKKTLGKESHNPLFGAPKDLKRIISVRLGDCRANPNQPRQTFDQEALQELANSIQNHGLLQPITVMADPENTDKYIIVAGERRFRAHELLKKPTIEAIVTTGKADEIALIENIQRENLNPIEEAEAYQRLADTYNYTQEDLAKSIGKGRVTVNETLSLNDLPEQIREEARTSSRASKTLLIELGRLKNPEQQQIAWQQVQTGSLTAREVRQLKQSGTKKSSKKRLIADKVISDAQVLVKGLKKLKREGVTLESEKYEALLEVYKDLGVLLEQLN